VNLSEDLVALIAETQPLAATGMRKSIGLNFGSKHLVDVSIWPVGQPIPQGALQAAANIFVFDALIDNVDRRYNNPNLFIS
jgi:hypothetical protein